MCVELNALGSDRFGIVAARVTDPSAPLAEIDTLALALGVEMLTARISTGDLARVQELEANGFRLMDTLVWYQRDLDDIPAPKVVPGETIREAKPDDAEVIGRVAEAGFRGYFGHYHSDPRLSDEAADAAYVDWALRSARAAGPDAPVLLVEADGEAAGFLTFVLKAENIGELVLSAIRPDLQGGGLYGRIIDHGLALLKQRGCRAAQVSTQINNVAVQRAWARRGFRMAWSVYTFHKWM
ncbi:MAG: GNAT family N-acetyltransferase [Pseudomonadota bacterium]